MDRKLYLSTPAWSELVVEPVLGRPTLVWRERPRHVLDLLDLAPDDQHLELFVQGDRRISFGGFRQGVNSAARSFAGLGVSPGNPVLLLLFNSPEVLLAQWGLWRCGAVPVFGNRWWSESEVDEVIDRVRPGLIVTDMPLSQATLRRAKAIDPVSMQGWLEDDGDAVIPDPRDHSQEDDRALVVFTAGSTGAPKGVQLSHRNLIWSQQTIHNMRGGRPPIPASPGEQKVTLLTTPMFHNGAIVTGISALIDGNRIVMLMGKFVPEEVLCLIEQERVTAWQAVPTMFRRVLQHPDIATRDLSSLVAPSSGGMHVPEALMDLLDQKLPQAGPNLVVGYGMTEMSFLTMATRAQMKERPGTVGRPMPGVEMRVDSPDSHGQAELLGRSGALMIGYLGTTEQPIDAEGWYHTGDLGRIDAEGFVHVTGRVKDMIIRGGENIASAYVESALSDHPDVLEAAVCGYPDEQLGEAVGAVVRIRPGSGLLASELASYARSKLAYFSVPSRWIIQSDPLPVLATGKIDKVKLSEWLRQMEPSDA